MKKKHFLLSLAALCAFFGASANAQSYAITNARIVPVSGPTIDRGTVIVRNGLIEAVGANLKAPADAQVFDGNGLTVFPGFIDPLTNLGIAAPQPGQGGGGGGGGFAAQLAAAQAAAQGPASNSNYPNGLRPEKEIYEDLRNGEAQFETARNAGFTTVVTTGRTGIFNGQSVVINLGGDSISEMTVKEPFAHHVTFTTVGGGVYPVSLLGTFSALRQMFLDAQRLQDMQKAYAADPKMKRPIEDRSLEALFPAVNRQIPVVFTASREIEIIRALDLIRELNLRGIIAGGLEAGNVADRLKAQNVPVLLSLNLPRRTAANSPEADPESLQTLRFRAEAPKTASRLAAAGVKFAFYSGNATSVGDFFFNAQKVVDAGLAKDAAIRAMTLGPAEILGLETRLGSIEPGKIANLTLVRGDVFARDRFVPQVIIDGKVFEQKEPARPATGGRGPGAGQPAAATATLPNISGTYSIAINIPGQPTTATLTFNQQGATFTGTMVSNLGTTQIRAGRVTGDGFSFTGVSEFGGQTLDINVKGTVSGNTISGTIDSSLGSVPFTGTKNP